MGRYQYDKDKELFYTSAKKRKGHLRELEYLVDEIRKLYGREGGEAADNHKIYDQLAPFIADAHCNVKIDPQKPNMSIGTILTDVKRGQSPEAIPAILGFLWYRHEDTARKIYDQFGFKPNPYEGEPNLDFCPKYIADSFEYREGGKPNSKNLPNYVKPVIVGALSVPSIFVLSGFAHFNFGIFDNILPSSKRETKLEYDLAEAEDRVGILVQENQSLFMQNQQLSDQVNAPKIDENSCNVQDQELFEKLWPTYGQNYCSIKSKTYKRLDDKWRTAEASFSNLQDTTRLEINRIQSENNRTQSFLGAKITGLESELARFKRQEYGEATFKYFGPQRPKTIGKILTSPNEITIKQKSVETITFLELSITIDKVMWDFVNIRAGYMDSYQPMKVGDYLRVKSDNDAYMIILLTSLNHSKYGNDTVSLSIFEG